MIGTIEGKRQVQLCVIYKEMKRYAMLPGYVIQWNTVGVSAQSPVVSRRVNALSTIQLH